MYSVYEPHSIRTLCILTVGHRDFFNFHGLNAFEGVSANVDRASAGIDDHHVFVRL